MSICSANMSMKSEARKKKPDRLMRKGVGIEVFFTGWKYNVCEKKIHPYCIFKDKTSLHIYIIARMVKKQLWNIHFLLEMTPVMRAVAITCATHAI